MSLPVSSYMNMQGICLGEEDRPTSTSREMSSSGAGVSTALSTTISNTSSWSFTLPMDAGSVAAGSTSFVGAGGASYTHRNAENTYG